MLYRCKNVRALCVIEKCGFKYVKQVESEVKALQKKLLEDVYILYR